MDMSSGFAARSLGKAVGAMMTKGVPPTFGDVASGNIVFARAKYVMACLAWWVPFNTVLRLSSQSQAAVQGAAGAHG